MVAKPILSGLLFSLTVSYQFLLTNLSTVASTFPLLLVSITLRMLLAQGHLLQVSAYMPVYQ